MKTKTEKTPPRIRGGRGMKTSSKSNIEFLLMVLPGTLMALIFSYIPMFGICIAFKSIDYAKGIFGSPWVGLKNFRFLFQNPDVYIILRNTIGYNLIFIVVGVVVPVTIAIMLNQITNKRGAKLYQTIMILPHFISYVVVSYVVFAFFSYNLGLLNTSLLPKLGLEPINWYSKVEWWPFIIVFIYTWKGFGYGAVVYLASIAGIDASLYEAAAIDGATRRQQTWYIIIPELSNIIIIMTILAIGRIMSSDFGLFYNVPMENGKLFPATNVISTFVYRALKLNGDVGMSSAAGFLQSVVGFILVVTTNAIVKRYDESKSLF